MSEIGTGLQNATGIRDGIARVGGKRVPDPEVLQAGGAGSVGDAGGGSLARSPGGGAACRRVPDHG